MKNKTKLFLIILIISFLIYLIAICDMLQKEYNKPAVSIPPVMLKINDNATELISNNDHYYLITHKFHGSDTTIYPRADAQSKILIEYNDITRIMRRYKSLNKLVDWMDEQ